MSNRAHTVGSFLFEYLYEEGISDAFGIPGDFVLPTIRWLEESKMNLITMTHEPSVGFAADCYARSKGLGLAIVTYCVGGLNTLNSIACAYAEKSPVIVISGGPSSQERSKDSLLHHKVRSFDTQRKIYEEVTCANTILLDPDTAASEIIRVVEEVKKSCRPGYIEVPFDVVDMPITIDAPKNKEEEITSDKESLEACLEEAVERISKAKKPVIVAGVELHRHHLVDAVVQFAEKYQIPIAATLLSKGVIRETNPLYIGVFSGALSEPECQKYIDESDCVIMLGTFISDVLLGFYSVTLNKENTILVTTESAKIGLHSYEEVLFKEFLEGLSKSEMPTRETFVNPNPAKTIMPLADEDRDKPLEVESFFNILASHVDEGSSFVCDTGDALVGAIGVRTAKRSHFFADAYYLSMGFAVPGSIGVMVADPKSKVFTIVGDGAFQMTGMEVSTIAKYGLKPIIFIINNDGYGTQRHILDGEFNNITRWHYAKVRDVIDYGKSATVTTLGELEDVLTEALNTDEMYMIELIVPRDDCSHSLQRMGELIRDLRNNKT